MGGNHSTRKIGMENNEPVGVIRVSENVAQRLKSVNNGGNYNNSAIYNKSGPSSELSVNNPNFNHQQFAGSRFPQPFITSSMIREEVEKELEKNDHYWERKIKSLQDNQNKITSILESEFDKACKDVESSFPSLAPKDAAVPCQDYKSMIVDCLKNNANHTLNCSPVVKNFTSCVNNSRFSSQRENRSP